MSPPSQPFASASSFRAPAPAFSQLWAVLDRTPAAQAPASQGGRPTDRPAIVGRSERGGFKEAEVVASRGGGRGHRSSGAAPDKRRRLEE